MGVIIPESEGSSESKTVAEEVKNTSSAETSMEKAKNEEKEQESTVCEVINSEVPAEVTDHKIDETGLSLSKIPGTQARTPEDCQKESPIYCASTSATVSETADCQSELVITADEAEGQFSKFSEADGANTSDASDEDSPSSVELSERQIVIEYQTMGVKIPDSDGSRESRTVAEELKNTSSAETSMEKAKNEEKEQESTSCEVINSDVPAEGTDHKIDETGVSPSKIHGTQAKTPEDCQQESPISFASTSATVAETADCQSEPVTTDDEAEGQLSKSSHAITSDASDEDSPSSVELSERQIWPDGSFGQRPAVPVAVFAVKSTISEDRLN